MPPPEKLDVVYTWVDGAWEGYADVVQQYAETRLDLNPNRFRDNLDMLRYSIRSLERNAPWLGNLYLVTARPQVPAWLDPTAPGLRLVHHDEIFDSEYLPSFNSLAIVSNLHRIPGISRRFVYFEDDKLLGREVAIADLIDPSTDEVRIFERYSFEDNAWRHDNPKLSLWGSVLGRSNHLLNEAYGRRWHGALHEAPIVIDTLSFEAMVQRWKSDVHTTRASRFRVRGNVALEHMFPYYLHAEGAAVFAPKREVYRDTSYMALENSVLLTRLGLARLRHKRPKFYCMNDNYGDVPKPRCVELVREFLEERYPEPSRFERA